MKEKINLSFNFDFQELYSTDGLQRLDQRFLLFLDGSLSEKLLDARKNPDKISAYEQSVLIIELSKHLEIFLGKLFNISEDLETLKDNNLKVEFEIKDPKRLDFQNLIAVEREEINGVENIKIAEENLRNRDGFKLTDKGNSTSKISSEVDYCTFCYDRGRDSCSQGFKKNTGEFLLNKMKTELTGCPLEEKISELNLVRDQGFSLAALAITTVDNPMVPATGHRICNDCVLSCKYQMKEAVDVPSIETNILKEVLDLPWGFEIYSLLTRWNPLDFKRYNPKPDSGKKVLVVGLGPAGFTLSHHLLNEGHVVIAIDGAKIEPLSDDLVGDNFKPVKNIEDLYESLDDRVIGGFGGVMEYGITVRWDKNFLKLIRLVLERRNNFLMFGGTRFGSQLTIESAFDEFNFDHIALCMGAGQPTIIDMKNGFARGVRQASDFLMSLQLTGAAKSDSPANLQLRLPVTVIGGGLTAIDTATESLAYYPIQVEKFLKRYEILCASETEVKIRSEWNQEELGIVDEFISHARSIREEKKKDNPSVISLLQKWGGATIIYRKSLNQSPAYRLNSEEVEKALEEGIYIVENNSPREVILDNFGHTKELKIVENEGIEKIIPAKSILVAAGTKPNTVVAEEFPQHFKMNGNYFNAIDLDGNNLEPEWRPKPANVNIFASKYKDKMISFFGDLHPDYAGNVVRAMGSAKQGYPFVSKAINNLQKDKNTLSTAIKKQKFLDNLTNKLTAKIHKINRLTENIIEVVVHAPLAAKNFKAGQFFRLQNFETNAPIINGTKFAMEGVALTGAFVSKCKGKISLIVLEMGGSSSLIANLKKDEPVILMGPTGEATEIPEGNETVCLVGGGLGNAVLFSIGKECKEKGNKVIYFAGYRKSTDRYYVKKIEEASDIIIWCCDEKSDFKPERPQDIIFTGNIVEAMHAYGTEEISSSNNIPLSDVDRFIVIGSDRMMKAVKEARAGILKPYLKENHHAIASINSPMQCMMKKICGQCLQPHTDPITGAVKMIYSCQQQDQPMDSVDFEILNQRLGQNSVQEKLTKLWIKHSL